MGRELCFYLQMSCKQQVLGHQWAQSIADYKIMYGSFTITRVVDNNVLLRRPDNVIPNGQNLAL